MMLTVITLITHYTKLLSWKLLPVYRAREIRAAAIKLVKRTLRSTFLIVSNENILKVLEEKEKTAIRQ